MRISNALRRGLLSTLSLAGAAGLLASGDAAAISFGQGGEFPWGTPLLELNGAAHVQNTPSGQVLRLVDDVQGEAGSAFFINPYVLGVNSDFAVSFTFQMSSSNSNTADRSDGIAFVIAAAPTSLGSTGGGLGYGGLARSLEVEFDIHDNDFDYITNPATNVRTSLTDSHIGVMENGDETNHLASANVSAPMDNGHAWQALIRYFGQGDLLLVNLSDLDDPNVTAHLSYVVDIPDLMGCNPFGCRDSYFGLTAATGAGFANHDVLSMSFFVPEPGSLLLATLGLSTLAGLRRRRSGN